MKQILLVWTAMLFAGFAMAQTDSTMTKDQKVDTIRIGGMIIIKKKGDYNNGENDKNFDIEWNRHSRHQNKNVETSFMVMDFGFANFTDKTNYASADAKSYARTTRPNEAAFTASDFKLRNFKSLNFNLWFFLQKRNLINHVLNLKYGLGIETNNYHWDNNLTFVKGTQPYVFRDSISFSKNKLALDYITVPVMLNFNTNPKKNSALSMSFGASFGYLYSGRTKQKSSERGKQKVHSAFDTKDWKVSLVGELGIGPLKLYGSYVPKNIFDRGLDFRPYNVGVRLGGWD
ncbi:MAG: outer membrane beta-barrel protein [Chitinophagaceae bacterium]